MWKRMILILIFIASPLSGQGLFESALREETSRSEPAPRFKFELNGYVRGGMFLGEYPGRSGLEAKYSAAETALKLRVRKGDLGDAFAEFRLSEHFLDQNTQVEMDVREAYVNLYLGSVDLRIGEQIVVWGRADGFNPTNTITPMNMLVFSPVNDDRRGSNFLLRSFWNLGACRLEAIWVPVYRPSTLAFERVDLPPGVTMGDSEYPSAGLSNSAVAIKLNVEKPSFDGSISYFNGYALMTGIQADVTEAGGCLITPVAYRTKILGADFSTTLGRYGLRGEFALSLPGGDDPVWGTVPNSQFEGVVGLDREFGDISLILQYIGKHVFDFDSLPGAAFRIGHGIQSEIRLWNRMMASQLEAWTHSVSFKSSLSLLHQTLSCEVLGLVNFTTGEVFLKPQASLSPVDDLSVTVGFQWYSGPDDTLFGRIDKSLSAFFLEIKTSF